MSVCTKLLPSSAPHKIPTVETIQISSTEDCTNKMWCIQVTEFCLAIKAKKCWQVLLDKPGKHLLNIEWNWTQWDPVLKVTDGVVTRRGNPWCPKGDHSFLRGSTGGRERKGDDGWRGRVFVRLIITVQLHAHAKTYKIIYFLLSSLDSLCF